MTELEHCIYCNARADKGWHEIWCPRRPDGGQRVRRDTDAFAVEPGDRLLVAPRHPFSDRAVMAGQLRWYVERVEDGVLVLRPDDPDAPSLVGMEVRVISATTKTGD